MMTNDGIDRGSINKGTKVENSVDGIFTPRPIFLQVIRSTEAPISELRYRSLIYLTTALDGA